jgi:hypothetical protein
MRLHSLAFILALGFLGTLPAFGAPKSTLADLKRLPITCLVPAWLPEGYRLQSVEIDATDREGIENPKAPGFPSYSIEYSDGKKGQFTIECARIGIGDRNLDDDENAEESEFETKAFGKVYIIYLPKGKTGSKKRIVANWIADRDWRTEEKAGMTTRIKGRVHGVSGFGMTLAEFEKIVRSLHPVRDK